MENCWKKIDITVLESPPVLLDATDECYYARDYQSRARFDSCEANDLIFNFKKPPTLKGTNQWKWKLWAIDRFAAELASIIPNKSHVAAIPASKRADHPEYDDRMEMTLAALKKRDPT